MTDYIYQENVEVWRDIEGYEGLYQISDHGQVKSLARTKLGRWGNVMEVKERILKPVKTKSYLQVGLYNGSVSKKLKIHRLVATAFCNNDSPETKTIINHLDHTPTNNKSNNLEWTDQKGNINWAWDNGRMEEVREVSTGENSSQCKLTDEDVNEIRTRYATGNVLQKDLAEEFEISQAQISYIINNKQRKRHTPSP